MFRRSFITLMSVVAIAGSAAAQGPTVREIRYTANGLPTLATQIRYTTIVRLPDGEGIMDIACGDVDFWITNIVGNTALIKPAKEGASTNVTIFGTSGRIYPFLARESKTTPPDVLVTMTVDPDPVVRANKFVPVAQVEALQAEIEQAHATVDAAMETAQKEKAAAVQDAPKQLRFLWQPVPYSKPFLVRTVFTDGAHTYLRTDAPELAAIYEIKDAKPSLVIPEVPEKGLYRIDKVMGDFYLQLGKVTQRVLLLPSGN